MTHSCWPQSPRGGHAPAKMALRIPRGASLWRLAAAQALTVFSRSAADRDCNVVCRRNRHLGAQLALDTAQDLSSPYRIIPVHHLLHLATTVIFASTSYPSSHQRNHIYHCTPHQSVRLISPPSHQPSHSSLRIAPFGSFIVEPTIPPYPQHSRRHNVSIIPVHPPVSEQ